MITFFIKYNVGNWAVYFKMSDTMSLYANLMCMFKFTFEIGCIRSAQP